MDGREQPSDWSLLWSLIVSKRRTIVRGVATLAIIFAAGV
jgi:hypothetical protein